MIEGIIDIYTVYHVFAALGIGLFLSLLFKNNKKVAVFAAVVPIFWEVLEQNILVSWTGLLEAEPILNSITDIGIGFAFVMIGFIIGNKVLKK